MPTLAASVALLDIEGTLGSIAFVRDVLFPFARERMSGYVMAHADEPEMQTILDEAAREAQLDRNDLGAIIDALHHWSDNDVKITPLKALQGHIWLEGFTSSGIRGHLYDDAIDALRRFHGSGVRLYIYSSGSVPAQKLLFGHSVGGDLLPLFDGFYDTTIGGKREAQSYERIAREIGVPAQSIVFFSDVALELDAASSAGMQTVQLARPQDGTQAAANHTSVPSFAGVEIVAKRAP